jgi:hypothetical protein
MTTFDEREMGFEAKYAHDAEVQFRVVSRRNRLLGLWAGGLMGLTGQGLEDYAAAVIHSEIAHPDDADVLRKLHSDLSAAGLGMSESQISSKMAEMHAVARTQIQKEL